MGRYHIIGRAGAGSLIAEFLFREVGVDYDISFPDPAEVKAPDFHAANPLGRIPVLICPDGHMIFETLAIVGHITGRYEGLAPAGGTALFDRYNQYMALLATSVYPAYHRQHHSRYYGDEASFDSIRACARAEQAIIFDHIESVLGPYLCGQMLTAADFYLYMLSRWDIDKTAMRAGRPRLNALLDEMRARPSVDAVIAAQPRRRQKA
jgi:glutathione S-transferase